MRCLHVVSENRSTCAINNCSSVSLADDAVYRGVMVLTDEMSSSAENIFDGLILRTGAAVALLINTLG